MAALETAERMAKYGYGQTVTSMGNDWFTTAVKGITHFGGKQ